MENRREEFLKTVCQIYMTAVLVVLPLYYIPGNGYYKLGDSKYYLYRNVSLICMGICLATGLIAVLSSRRVKNGNRFGKRLFERCREHTVTTAVCLYGFIALLSALSSPYAETAWTGEREWYMGAVTICLMAGGFLLTANYSRQCKEILYLGETAFVGVTLIGLFQKLGYDPLGLLRGFVVGDWEYTHLISTLGNSNWLSGYYSVMFPLSLALFLQAVTEKKINRILLLGAGNALAVMLLLLQGSDGGVLVAGVAVLLSFCLNRKQSGWWEALLLMLAVACAGMYLWGKEMKAFGTCDILLQDGIAKDMAGCSHWMLFALICLILCGIYHGISENKKRILQSVLLYGSLATGAAMVLWYLHRIAGTNFSEWGNRRGMLWQMAWQGFREGNVHQKLLGAGPDCFARYLGEVLPGGTVLFDNGYFNGSEFTNAHNEWLTTLINMGVTGVVIYGAVFVMALREYRKDALGVLLLCTYGIHSLISFQQVLNAPIFFLLLGVCEARHREAEQQIDMDEEFRKVR